VVAQELNYNAACLAALYNERAYLKAIDQQYGEKNSCSIELYLLAFSGLLIYPNERKNNIEGTPSVMFK